MILLINKIISIHNGWYTPEQVYFSIQSWKALTEENLNQWLSAYDLQIKAKISL
jgi:hypothetical protein